MTRAGSRGPPSPTSRCRSPSRYETARITRGFDLAEKAEVILSDHEIVMALDRGPYVGSFVGSRVDRDIDATGKVVVKGAPKWVLLGRDGDVRLTLPSNAAARAKKLGL
jgi:hypothetical protein